MVDVRYSGQTVSIVSPQYSVEVVSGILDADMPYAGAYEIMPTAEPQVLHTRGKTLADDVTVNPIPSNYGLITWNGSILMVS